VDTFRPSGSQCPLRVGSENALQHRHRSDTMRLQVLGHLFADLFRTTDIARLGCPFAQFVRFGALCRYDETTTLLARLSSGP